MDLDDLTANSSNKQGIISNSNDIHKCAEAADITTSIFSITKEEKKRLEQDSLDQVVK